MQEAYLLGVTMKLILVIILILGTCLFKAYRLAKRSKNRVDFEKMMEREAKKSVRLLTAGLIVLAFFWLAISNFDLLRSIGFSLISKEQIEIFRSLMKVFLGTHSVYVAMGTLTIWVLFIIQFSILFSFVSIIATKKILLPRILVEEPFDIENDCESNICNKQQYRSEKIFFRFANLRI
jgi:hypothetical protein